MHRENKSYTAALELEAKGGDPNKILKLLELAASQGSSDAQYALGTFYLHGKYVKIDFQKTLDYFRDAADQMHPSALFDLGVALEEGIIVDKNVKEAFTCYFHSMISGDKDAIEEVSRCFYYGIGIRKNIDLYEIVSRAKTILERNSRKLRGEID